MKKLLGLLLAAVIGMNVSIAQTPENDYELPVQTQSTVSTIVGALVEKVAAKNLTESEENVLWEGVMTFIDNKVTTLQDEENNTEEAAVWRFIKEQITYHRTKDDAVACTLEYAPVCGQPLATCVSEENCDFSLPQTYGNVCQMNADNAILIREGECTYADNSFACTKEYRPMCGVNSIGQIKTYSNKCMLDADNAGFLYEGVCEEDNN